MMRSRVDLPATAGPEQGRQLTAGHGQVDVVQGDEVAEALGDVSRFDPHQLCSFGRIKEMATMQITAKRTSTSAT